HPPSGTSTPHEANAPSGTSTSTGASASSSANGASTASPDTPPGPALATAPVGVPAAGLPAAAPPPPPSNKSGESAWKFSYHGYLRAPLRFGVGRRRDSDLPPGYDISGTRTTVHEATVPDDQYLSFQSTSHNPRSWAEGFFTFGNSWASGTLGIG